MSGEGAGIVDGIALWTFGSLAGGRFGQGFAGHLDVAAEGQQADLVVGIAAFDAEEAGAEADGEGLDADSAQLGDGEMAEFVNDHHDADEDDESDDCDNDLVKVLHRVRVFPWPCASFELISSYGISA